MQDGFYIRRSAAEMNVPCFTSIDTARCAVESGSLENTQNFNIMTLKEYLSN